MNNKKQRQKVFNQMMNFGSINNIEAGRWFSTDIDELIRELEECGVPITRTPIEGYNRVGEKVIGTIYSITRGVTSA